MKISIVNKSIRAQLTVLLFGLTGAAILILGTLGIKAVWDSGRQAEKVAGTAMSQRAEQFLVETTSATAAKNSIIFGDIQHKSHYLADYVEGVFAQPANFSAGHWRYDANVARHPNGTYGNSASDAGSVFVYKDTPITTALKREIELTTYLDYIAPQTIKDEPNIAGTYFVGTQGESVYYPNINLADIADPNFNPATAEFYTMADPAHDPEKQTKWSSVYDDPAGNGLLITAAHPIYMQDKTFAGIMGTDVPLSNIAKNIEDYSPIESSYALLVDKNGRAIALPKQGYKDILGRRPASKEFGTSLAKPQGGFGAVLTAMRTGKNGFAATAAADGSRIYVAYAPVSGTDFSLGIVAKQEALLHVVSTMHAKVQDTTRNVLYVQMLPAVVLLFALVWFAGLYYIRQITNPIIALTDQTRRVRQGNFNQMVTVHSSNEIGKLASAFNAMLEQLEASYHSLQKKVHELAAAKAKDEAMLNSVGDGVIVADPKGNPLLVNNAAANLLGVGRNAAFKDRVMTVQLFDEQGDALPRDDLPLQEALRTRKMVVRDVMVKRHNVHAILSLTATPVLDRGKLIGSIQIFHDVTREKEIDRMKNEFISLASHQLRTPLSAIKWYVELLLDGNSGKLTRQQKHLLQSVDVSTDRMSKLVGALLNISRIESGRIMVDPKPTDVHAFVDGIVDSMQAKLQQRNQRIHVTIDPSIGTVPIDQRLVGEVYLNLLTNASKYTPVGGTITVTVEPKGKDILTSVTDTGYGIPKDEQPKIFGKFFRATNILRIETDGTGLGLYLAKSIVESSNGRIWFESHEGKGTAFFFTLPRTGMVAHKGEVTIEDTSPSHQLI